MTEPPVTAPHVALLSVDRSQFLFNEETQQLFALNPVAAYIWTCLADGLGLDQAARLMAKDFGLPRAEASAHVEQMAREWTSHRMLLSEDAPTAAAPPPIRKSIGLAGEPFERPTGLRFDATRRVRLLDQRFEIRFAAPGSEAMAMDALLHLEPASSAPPRATVDVIGDAGAIAIAIGATAHARCRSPDEVAPALKRVLTVLAIEAEPYALAFHSAAVATADGGAILMPGVAGTGKSTLTAGLLKSGFRYLSDDIVLLDQPEHRIRGFPFPVCIKTQGVAAVASHYPGAESRPVHLRADDERVVYLPPPAASWSQGAAATTSDVRWMVFPRYDAGAATRLDAVEPGAALTRLLAQGAAGTRFATADVAMLAGWIGTVACFDLTMSSLPEAIDLVRSMAGSPRRNGAS